MKPEDRMAKGDYRMRWPVWIVSAVGIVMSASLLPARVAHADHPGGGAAVVSEQPSAFMDLASLNLRLRELHVRLQHADPGSRPRALAALVAAAQARARRLVALMEDAPGEVLHAALSARERARFPAEVRSHLEEEASEDGELEVLHEDRWGSDRYRYALRTDRGLLAVYFARLVPNLMTGDVVRVNGIRVGAALAADGASAGVTLVSAALPSTFGEQTTVVIVVNFSNSSNPYTASSVSNIQNVTFGSGGSTAAAYYQETSYGAAWLTGTVVGPFTISMTSSGCDYYGLAAQARAAATAAGVNLGQYRRHVFAFPSNGCGWWGLGTIGGNPSQAWINGNYQAGVVVHELGHNFGLWHSHALECGSVVVGTNCSSIEYGDTLDAMGKVTPPHHFNAVQKELLGWLNYAGMPPVTTVQSSGVYTLDPFEPVGTNPKALKVRAGNGDWYYVEYRQPIGFDAAIPPSVRTGVVVHLWKGQSGDGIYLLDMTPNTSSWMDPALQVNTSFGDGAAGISITPLWTNGTDAGVSVNVGGSSCTRTSPAVAVSPALKAGSAGTRVSYNVSITNRDSGNCAATTISTQATKPTGWAAAFTTASLSLAPGATATTTLDVTSSSSAPPGDYNIGISAATASASSSTTATYEVTPAGGGGASGGFTDSFDRPDASSLGNAWTAVGQLLVQGNQARNAPVMALHMATVTGLTGGDQSASARFTVADTNHGPRFGVLLRYRDARNYYACYRQTGGVRNLRIIRVVNGAERLLARMVVPNPKMGESFDVSCSATGNVLTLTMNGSTAVATDSALASGGVGFLMGYTKQKGKAQSNSADDFTAQVK